MTNRLYGTGNGGGGYSFYLSPNDLKKLDELRVDLEVPEKFMMSRSLTVSKLIQNTHAQLHPPRANRKGTVGQAGETK